MKYSGNSVEKCEKVSDIENVCLIWKIVERKFAVTISEILERGRKVRKEWKKNEESELRVIKLDNRPHKILLRVEGGKKSRN